MVINPFHTKALGMGSDTTGKLLETQVNLDAIQKIMVEEHKELLQKGLKEETRKQIEKYLYQHYTLTEDKVAKMTQELIHKMFGYDILQKYIEDEKVTDIRVVAFDHIYIKREGRWKKTEDSFENAEVFTEYIRYCMVKNNANINLDMPIMTVADKRYHLRMEAGISPVNAISPSLVIRIHRENCNLTLETLHKQYKMMTKECYQYLIQALKLNKNMIISGKGGSGKTTLLRALLQEIPQEKAITINEETTELYLQGKNVIQREIKGNREESKKITLRILMEHALVMSNDIIVVGELKGAETTSFVDAICTGHQGFATVHSDSATHTISRLVTLFKRDIKAQAYREEFITQLLKESIHSIVFLENFKIKEILDLVTKEGEIRYETIYVRGGKKK